MTLLKTNARDRQGEFHAPQTMTPEELGDNLARLVWESFSDFLAESERDLSLTDVLAQGREAVAERDAAEEALIFFMWAHTRGTQLAFIGRTEDALLRQGLDLMHRAVFDDMALHGTPRAQLPIFEQRVSARYAEYSAAADLSDGHVGLAVVRHLTGIEEALPASVRAVTERAIAVANPLRDFLEDVELTL